jgi:hypothetical protein
MLHDPSKDRDYEPETKWTKSATAPLVIREDLLGKRAIYRRCYSYIVIPSANAHGVARC